MKIIKYVTYVAGVFLLAGCASVTITLTPQERASIEEAAARGLPSGADVSVDTQSRFLARPDLVISAHLLQGHSADEKSPYVRGDYGTHDKLTRLVRFRSAKIVKSLIMDTTLPNVDGIVINARHGVRQSYVGQSVARTDVAMTLYTVRFVLEPTDSQLTEISEEEIIDRFLVKRNIIPTLHFSARGW